MEQHRCSSTESNKMRSPTPFSLLGLHPCDLILSIHYTGNESISLQQVTMEHQHPPACGSHQYFTEMQAVHTENTNVSYAFTWVIWTQSDPSCTEQNIIKVNKKENWLNWCGNNTHTHTKKSQKEICAPALPLPWLSLQQTTARVCPRGRGLLKVRALSQLWESGVLVQIHFWRTAEIFNSRAWLLAALYFTQE